VESYFSDIGGTLGLFLGMSLMSIVEFVELLLDLIIYAIIRCSLSVKARRRLAARRNNAALAGAPGAHMPWEAPPSDGQQFMYRDKAPPPSYRAAARGSRALPNDVRDILLNM